MQLFIFDPPHILLKEGKEIILDKPVYNISDEKIISLNGFFKCSKCKNYFDRIQTYAYVPDKQFCSACFPVIKKSED